jgi:hypothetical protein
LLRIGSSQRALGCRAPGLAVVSQLLAGPRSGYGRSPGPSPVGYEPQGGAARPSFARRSGLREGGVARQANEPPQAPHLIPPFARFATAPPKRTRWTQDNGGLEGGDKFQSDKPRRLSVFRG